MHLKPQTFFREKFGCSVLRSRLNIHSLIFLSLKFLSSPVAIYLGFYSYSKDALIDKTLVLDFSLSLGYLLQRSVPANVFGQTFET